VTQNFSPEWLQKLGDPRSEGASANSLKQFAESYAQFTRGYRMDPAQIILDGLMPANHAAGQTITAGPISFYSLCEHHLLPFFGTAEITYTAGEYILGLGKFPKVVEALSARLNIQENLTAAIWDALHAHLRPKSLSVSLEARHLCLDMRGGHGIGTLLKTIKNC
jgi:GTP cyclohydrolase I